MFSSTQKECKKTYLQPLMTTFIAMYGSPQLNNQVSLLRISILFRHVIKTGVLLLSVYNNHKVFISVEYLNMDITVTWTFYCTVMLLIYHFIYLTFVYNSCFHIQSMNKYLILCTMHKWGRGVIVVMYNQSHTCLLQWYLHMYQIWEFPLKYQWCRWWGW
jgi:hypothetical protein